MNKKVLAQMAQLNFFAAQSDLRSLFEFLFAMPEVRVFESYSRPEMELREFKSFEELSGVFPMECAASRKDIMVTLQIHSSCVMKKVEIQRFALNPRACDGKTFRFKMEGYALMQLYLTILHEGVLGYSHFGHQSETRARKWGYESGVDWDALKEISNKIQYHIRKRLAVAKAGPCPVLPAALELYNQGVKFRDGIGGAINYTVD